MLGKKPSVYTVAFSHYVNEDKILLARSATGFVTLYLDGQGIDEHLGEISLKSKKVYMTDHLGSVLNSPLAGEYKAYGAFGTSTLIGKVLAQIRRDEPVMYGFTGREYDAESGLYYYRARMYDAELGRFLTKDPIGFAGGSTNLYGYVLNDPINLVDPSGLSPGFKYPSAAAAAAAAGQFYTCITNATGAEHAGWVYKNPDGSYSYTPPNVGAPGAGTSHPGAAPAGGVSVYHTHPPGLPFSDTVSPMDESFSIRNGIPVNATSPSGMTNSGSAGPGVCPKTPLNPNLIY